MVRDMDLLPQDHQDGRRLEVVDRLPLYHGAQLAVDTALVSPVSRDGLPPPRSVREDGAVLGATRRRKEKTCPELTGQFGRTRLVVLAGEVGGRWSETQAFLRQLVKARARSKPVPQQARARQRWLMRWRALLAYSSARVLATLLLEVRAGGGCDGPSLTTANVVGEHRHVRAVAWGGVSSCLFFL